MNNVNLIGRLTKDAVLKYTPNGKPVATFTLAVKNKYNPKGEPDYVPCVVWEKKAENLANFTKKGSLVALEGQVKTSSYDGPNNKKVYVTEILAESITYLEPKSSNQGANQNGNNNNKGNQNNYNKKPYGSEAGDDYQKVPNNHDDQDLQGSYDPVDDFLNGVR